MHVADHEIIEKIRNGEKHEFALLVDRYKGKGMSLALRMMKNGEDAEEVLQDAFVRAYNGLGDFRGSASFGTWFYRILYNACLTRLKRKGDDLRLTRVEDEEEYGAGNDGTDGSHAAVERDDMIGFVRNILDSLPKKYTVVMSMFYLQDLTIEEICDVTRLPVGTVKVQLFRGRALLQERVASALSPERSLL